ncbi:MAG: hypothetical protein AAGA54_18230 [Myxococcota bacterium]
MRRIGLFLALSLSACGTTDDPGAAGGDDSSGGDGSSSTTGTSVSATAVSMTSSTDPGTTRGTSDDTTSTVTTDPTTDADTTATATEGSSSSSGGCAPGNVDCPCEDGGCFDGLVCEDDVCVPPTSCDQDLLEPNDVEGMATLLGEINDNDDNGGSIFGVLDGPDDADWYRYTGDDDILYNVDPSRFVDATAGVRMCKFAECENGIGATEVPCPAETEPAVSPEGRPGCCAPLGMEIEANCTGVVEDNMQVFMRIDSAEDACVPYELIYHF